MPKVSIKFVEFPHNGLGWRSADVVQQLGVAAASPKEEETTLNVIELTQRAKEGATLHRRRLTRAELKAMSPTAAPRILVDWDSVHVQPAINSWSSVTHRASLTSRDARADLRSPNAEANRSLS